MSDLSIFILNKKIFKIKKTHSKTSKLSKQNKINKKKGIDVI